MAVDELDQLEESTWRERVRGAGRLCAGDTARLLLGVGGGVMLGLLVGLRLGRAQGESAGLKKGIELGRLEGLSSIPEPQPRTWRLRWRRAA